MVYTMVLAGAVLEEGLVRDLLQVATAVGGVLLFLFASPLTKEKDNK
jgi:hypothetical protein